MGISAREIAVLVQGLSYLILTVTAARQFWRAPGALRFHTLLTFGSATSALLLTEAGIRLFGIGSQDAAAFFLLRLGLVCALLTAYAVFLLTADLTNIRRWLGWVGIGMLIFSGYLVLLALSSFSSALFLFPGLSASSLPLGICLVLSGSYLLLTIRFWYSSISFGGALRHRLQWLGASTALACCGVAFALARLLVPGDQATFGWITRLLLLLMALVLYLGCAPPTWLRHWWMLPELERVNQFSSAVILRPSEASAAADAASQPVIISEMLRAAMNGLGAFVGAVVLWNERAGALEIAASILPSEEGAAIDPKSVDDALLLEVFHTRQARLRRLSGRWCPFLRRNLDGGAILAAPLLHQERALGVVSLCYEHAPGLNQDDLARLQLFADQITHLLTARAQQEQEEQAAALTALRSEQKLKDELIAVVAHDMRTPLTVLKGRLQLLRRQLLKEGHASAAALVAQLDAPYNRLSQLITTLMDVSYIDTGRLQLLWHPVDLIGLVRKAVEASPGREVALEVVSEPDQQGAAASAAAPMVVMGDGARLEQVLGNLLDNARKYSPLESSITVRLERHAAGEEALLSVRDVGIGILPEDQPRLFERWFRATNSPSQHYTGLGLGLYLSHEIITRHNGRLWVKSSGIPGEGSTFFFTLPLLHPQQIANADPESRP